MNPSDIICIYIYESLKVVQATLTAYVAAAQPLLKKINTFLDSLYSLMKYTIDIAMTSIINAVKVFQKYLCDLIFNKIDMSAFCTKLYKCSIFLEEITDPTSLIFRTLKHNGIDLSQEQALANSLITDYTQFKSQICDYGFTFNFGISAIKKILEKYVKTLNEYLDLLYKKKDELRRIAQRYLDWLSNSGTFDLLLKLMKYFECAISNSDLCTTIDTSKSFYADTLAKLHIQEVNGSFKLDEKTTSRIDNGIDARIKEIDGTKDKINAMADELLKPSQVKAASNAFDIAKNIFPGGMSWDDIKHARFKKMAPISYTIGKIDAIKKIFIDKKDTDDDSIITSEDILENGKISDDGKEVTYKNTTAEIEGDETINIPDTQIPFDVTTDELFLDDETKNIYSTYAAGYLAAQDPNGPIAKQIYKTISNLSSFISEEELVKTW